MAYKDKTTEVMKLASATAQNVIGSAQRQGFLDSMAPRASKIRSSSMNMPSPYGAPAQGSKIRFASNTFAAQKATGDLWDKTTGLFSQGSLKGNVFGEGGRIVRPGAPVPATAEEDQGFGDRPVSGASDKALFGDDKNPALSADADPAVLSPGHLTANPEDLPFYGLPTPEGSAAPGVVNVSDTLSNHASRGNGIPEDMADGLKALGRIASRLYPTFQAGSPFSPQKETEKWLTTR